MNFNEYQAFTQSMAVYNENVYAEMPDGTKVRLGWTYPALALAEEAGEVNGKLAKFVRKYGTDSAELRKAVTPELGDVLFQVSEVARQFGITLQEVADYNREKLTDRKDRGVLVGEGDAR